MTKLTDILYSKNGFYLILETRKTPGLGKPYTAYVIYRESVTHATACATIGESMGFEYAKATLDTLAA